MTRTYAAKRLLEHGPLTLSEFVEITRWSQRAARAALESLRAAGQVRLTTAPGINRYLYRLA